MGNVVVSVSLLSAFYDMEHVIPLNRIISVETRQGWFTSSIYLVYANDYGDTQLLKLRPKNPMGFLRALGTK